MYDILHVLHVSAYILFMLYSWFLSGVIGFVQRYIVFVLLNAIFMLVCLKRLVSFLICGLWYVKDAHFLFSSLSCFWWIFVAFVFSGLLWVSPGNCCFVPWLVLFSIQIVVFLLLVLLLSFNWMSNLKFMLPKHYTVIEQCTFSSFFHSTHFTFLIFWSSSCPHS